MTQLLLDLEPPRRPTLDDFIVGRNAEVVAALRRLVARGDDDAAHRCLYLWGEAGSGRSHLCTAVADALGIERVEGGQATADRIRAGVDDGRDPALVVDEVEALDPVAQEALFHAINRVREHPSGRLLIAGNAPPRELALAAGREDLRSRLAWGLAYPLQRLADDEKDAALARRADGHGFPLTPDVRRYLMTHFSRDLGSLMRMVDALDRHAREHQRIVTVPLIRDFLQRRIEFPGTVEALGNAA